MTLLWRCAQTCQLLIGLVFLFCYSAAGQAVPQIVETANNANRITLSGNVHPMARTEFDRGAVSNAQPMTRMLLLLKRSADQEAALQDFLAAQQDKGSPNYHQWLTPDQFGAQFGPADADVQTVTLWLQQQGFTVDRVYAGKTVIEFSGNASQVQSTFAAAIRNYQVNGHAYIANANDPQIPAALAPVVAGIVSLHNFPRQSHLRVAGIARKIAGKHGLQPEFTFPIPGGTQNFYGLGPGDFATIYNSKALLNATPKIDGTGQTIAIVGETNINVQDVQNFRTMFGLPANFDSTNIILNGEDPGITSTAEEGEADLDVQWSGAVAPGATVKFVVSASTPASAGIDLSALYIIEHNLAGVMSESYGSCEAALGSAGNAFYNSLWEQAAAQGITVVVSSGDNGSAGCDDFSSATTATLGLAVNGIASTPYNIALGGTDFDDVNQWTSYWNAVNDSVTGTSALKYIPEIPWNQNCAQLGPTGCGSSAPNGSLNIVAGSGGSSSVNPKPSWQSGVTGIPNDSHRHLPDVSLFASPGFDGTGYIVCQQDQTYGACNLNSGSQYFQIIGGTSASAPAFAGVMALVNQYQTTHGGSAPQGNPNPVLYALAKKTGASCASSATELATCTFNDITHGNTALLAKYPASLGTISVPCQGGTPNCSAAVAGNNGVLVDPAHTSTEAWNAAAGYDMATGLGSVNINNLATNWGSVSTVATTTTLTLSPTTGITHGTNENVTVNIAVTPKSGTATGDVSLMGKFADGSTQGLDQFTLSSGKVSAATTNSLPGSPNGQPYQVYAHYAGDGTNAPSDSSTTSVTVAPEKSQTFIVVPSFDSSGNLVSGNTSSVAYGSRYILRMYVTDQNAQASTTGPPSGTCYTINVLTCPTGTVTLTDNGMPVDAGGGGAGIYNLNNAGYTRDLSPSTATFQGGSHSLVATYSGDDSYQKSSSAITLTVTPLATQTQMDSYPTRPVPGQVFQLEANVTSALTGRGVGTAAYPGGTVTFYDGSTALLGPVQITQGNSGQIYADIYNISFSTPGPHTISAQYSGDNNYGPSNSGPLTITVLIPTSMTQTESATTVNYGQTVTVTAVMTSGSKGPAITGQVYFQSPFGDFNTTSTTSGTDTNGNQMVTVTAAGSPRGSETVWAIYQGDANYGPSSTDPVMINVNIPDFSMGPTSGITIVPAAGQPGSAQVTVTPSTQTPSPVTLSMYPPITMSGYTIAMNPQIVNLNGAPVTATISLTPSPTTNVIRSQARHAGLNIASRGGYWLSSLAAGLAAVFLLGMPKRRRKYRAALGLTAVCLILFVLGCGGGGGTGGTGGGGGGGGVGPHATTITLSTSSSKVTQYTPLPITATVTSSSGEPITGTVTFYNFGTPFGSGYSVVPGQYTYQGNVGQLGVFQVTASYGGDSNNLPSTTSTPLIQMVTGTVPVTITGYTGVDSHSVQATIGLQ